MHKGIVNCCHFDLCPHHDPVWCYQAGGVWYQPCTPLQQETVSDEKPFAVPMTLVCGMQCWWGWSSAHSNIWGSGCQDVMKIKLQLHLHWVLQQDYYSTGKTWPWMRTHHMVLSHPVSIFTICPTVNMFYKTINYNYVHKYTLLHYLCIKCDNKSRG